MQNGSQMSIGDWIQVIAIVTSLIVSLVSIIQTQKSLKITRETIESENRPYLSFYIEYPEKQKFHKFFALKNFGTSSAKIDSITFDKELDELNQMFKFSSLINGAIAPGQKYTSYIDSDYKETVNICIKYHDLNNRNYEETFELNTDIGSSLIWIDEETLEKVIDKSSSKIVKAINTIGK
ncbi:hypothetical protein D9N18_01055 [Lactococcus raffinolactis]|nr:hypothetical protein [Lactococcus raffinolactis]